jgi:hypothetical protein
VPSSRLLFCSLLVALLAPASLTAVHASNDLVPCADGAALCGLNRAEQLSLRFAGGGVSVQSGTRAGARLELVRFGRVGAPAPLSFARQSATGSRVAYERGVLTEWFESGPHGLQQGFDVPRRPAGTGELELALAVEGLVPELRGPDHVALTRAGVPQLVYRALRAWDARGTRLPSRMAVREGRIVLHVDDRDARYPIVIDPFVQQPKLQASDLQKNYEYGENLAIEGDRLLVSARGDKHAGAYAGAVHVYDWDGDSWESRTKLIADPPHIRDSFGSSIAMSGTTLAIGAEIDSSDGLARAGSAYVFEQSGDGYRQQQRLRSSDPAAGDFFGRTVDVEGDTLVVGAPLATVDGVEFAGKAHVFTRSGETWTEVQRLTAPELDPDGADYGWQVALDGDTLLVAAINGKVGDLMTGLVYVYRRGDAGFVYEATLAPPVPDDFQNFGGAIALEGNRALVGSSNDGPTGENYGAAYVFERSGTTWRQTARLAASDLQDNGRFGSAVSLDGDTALIGAAQATTAGIGIKAGAAYFFVLSRGSWREQARVHPYDGLDGDGFGTDVALSSRHVLVGAPNRDDFGSKSGAVYPFEDGSLALGDPCSNAADCPSGFCVDGVCCDAACGGTNLGDCRACRGALTGDADGHCALVPVDTACGDGTEGACNGADRCSASGSCEARLVADGTACEAGAFCTMGDSCRAGECVEGLESPCSTSQKCDDQDDLCYAACGDGVHDPREDCDDGQLNSDVLQDACRTTCVAPSCGDGVVDTGEQCDRGNGNSDDAVNGCRTNCTVARCGDGVIDAGESCDDGAQNDAGNCRGDCSLRSCGDGTKDPGEACDDGPENSYTRPDACRPTCVAAYCGDGVRDSQEGCDSGPQRSDTEPDACRTDCALPRCGDGIVDTGEECDTQGASARCTDSCERPAPPSEHDAGPVDTDAGTPDAGTEMDTDAIDARERSRSGCALGAGSAAPRPLLAILLLGVLARFARRRSKARAQH